MKLDLEQPQTFTVSVGLHSGADPSLMYQKGLHLGAYPSLMCQPTRSTRSVEVNFNSDASFSQHEVIPRLEGDTNSDLRPLSSGTAGPVNYATLPRIGT